MTASTDRQEAADRMAALFALPVEIADALRPPAQTDWHALAAEQSARQLDRIAEEMTAAWIGPVAGAYRLAWAHEDDTKDATP